VHEPRHVERDSRSRPRRGRVVLLGQARRRHAGTRDGGGVDGASGEELRCAGCSTRGSIATSLDQSRCETAVPRRQASVVRLVVAAPAPSIIVSPLTPDIAVYLTPAVSLLASRTWTRSRRRDSSPVR